MSADETPQSAEDKDRAERPSPLRNPRTRMILIVIVVAVLLAGGLWYWRYETHGRYMQSTNDAYVQADAVVVSPKVGGYVAELFVANNQQVKVGQPLLRIDSRDYQAQTAQYQAQIDVATANAQGVRAQISEQHAGIDQARAQLAQAKSAWQFAHGQVARYAPLASTGAETGEKLAQLRDQEKQAGAQVASAQAALTSAQRRIGTLQSQIGQALSQGKAAEAQLDAAKVNLGATVIRASIDGRVGDKSVQLGQFVQPGVRLMSVVPVDKLYVEANFKETQVGLIRVGQPVKVKVDALSGVEIIGHVESFSPGTGAQFSLIPPQNATGNFTKIVQRVPVRIAIDAGPETRKLLLPGMSVDVEVDTVSAKGARQQIEREQDAFNRRQGK
ncbi:HlyD family secretion protein [Sphingomonas sp. QA11]|uniref:HlyD family secretion protein n=1 Tax=Sphingomonas sp. QA11 TaxID=2950605 RepID=UPI00234BCD4E|nr:HlyD family secretion protein [Sphingomonas sp. QA11]WCM29462.1 HlyD family secretion protein [Sphingomonas sp. QA11]